MSGNQLHHGLCDCCAYGCDTCLYTACCGCCAQGDIAKWIGKDWANWCMLSLGLSFIGCPCVPVMLQYKDVKARQGMQGDDVADCCKSTFCQHCVVTQMYNEMKFQERAQTAAPQAATIIRDNQA